MKAPAHLSESERVRLRQLLPWYVNGTLPDPERTALRELIGSDLQTRREWSETKALAAFVVSEEALGQDPGLQRLRALIEPPRARPAWRRVAAILGPMLILAGAAGYQFGAARYVTLSEPTPAATPDDLLRLRVQLAPGTVHADLAAALQPLGARIVAGPAAPGLYTIEVPPTQRQATERMLQARFDPVYVGPAAY